MLVKIGSDIPLLGCIAFGIIDRGTNMLQVRPTSVCNINCTFCSVDGGPLSSWHKTFFEVDLDYLVQEAEKIIAMKGTGIEINIDSVGEPFCYLHLEELVRRLRKNPLVRKISCQTNATIWKDVDVDVLNVSIHAMDPMLAQKLANAPGYSIEGVREFIRKYKEKGVFVRLCPVWMPGVNDAEIPKIILFAKELGCPLGIQKYEEYRYSRKPERVQPLNWWKFYRQLEAWEREFGVPLKVTAKELGVRKAVRIPEVFKPGERVQVQVKHRGWFKNQMIGVARDRCISINNCTKTIGDTVNVKMMETKNNLYVAE